jgi:hypothetical protein
MRKLTRLLIVFALAVGATPNSFAFWQSRDSNYNVAIGAPPSNPVLTFVGTNTSFSAASNVYTSATVNFGPTAGFTTRRIICAVAGAGLWNGGIQSVTLGGITATQHVISASSAASPIAAIYSADVPAGTTNQTVAVTFNAGSVFGGPTIAIYTVDDALLASTTPTGTGQNFTGSSLTSLTTGSFNQSAGGFAVGYSKLGGSSGGGFVITGYTTDAFGGGNADVAGHLAVGSTGSTTATSTWTAPQSASIAVAAWR